jgi:tagatose 6-phosphate kinase
MILAICRNPSVDTYAWLEEIHPGKVNRIQKEQRFPGGKGVHVALAAAELGEEVTLLGFWGGATGQWIRESCEEQGIFCYGPEVEGWSRTCVTFKADNSFNETELLGAGPTISDADFESFLEEYQKMLPGAKCVTLSGSWPKGAPSDAYAQLLRIAHQADALTFLDTTGDQLAPALAEHPQVVHLNRTEAHDHFGEKDIVKNALLLARQCQYAVITAGAEGVYVANGKEVHHASCTVSNVYSAVGSGDCLLRGLAVAFHRGMTLEDAARLAAACGAANCIREDLGMFYLKDAERIFKEVAVDTARFL